eukprot:9480455-Pyramimonas_sp.AAC.1
MCRTPLKPALDMCHAPLRPAVDMCHVPLRPALDMCHALKAEGPWIFPIQGFMLTFPPRASRHPYHYIAPTEIADTLTHFQLMIPDPRD